MVEFTGSQGYDGHRLQREDDHGIGAKAVDRDDLMPVDVRAKRFDAPVAYRVHAAVGRAPEYAGRVFPDHIDAVRDLVVRHPDHRDAVARDPADAPAVRGNPHHPRRSFTLLDPVHITVGETLEDADRPECYTVEDADTLRGPDPQVTGGILGDTSYRIGDQTLPDGIVVERKHLRR